MDIGKRINTSLGKVIILDIQEKYLILFNEKNRQFIKANDYKKDNDNKVSWSGGGYYSSLNELIKEI